MATDISLSTLFTDELGTDETNAYSQIRDDIVDGYIRLFHLHCRQQDFADAQYCLQQVIAFAPRYRQTPDVVAAQIALSMLLEDHVTEHQLRQMAERDGLLNDPSVTDFLTQTKRFMTNQRKSAE